jgi:hypothetical protein
MRRFCLVAALALCSSPVLAQNLDTGNGEIRVNASLMMSQVISTADKSALTDAQTAARKNAYELAGGECKLLLDTIARECRLESLNVSSNLQNQFFRGDPSNMVLNTNSNATFRIVPKQQSGL